MFTQEYFYLVAGLPNIILDDAKPAKDIKGFILELKDHLSNHDFALIAKLFWFEDNENLLNILGKEVKFNQLGNYSSEELSNALETLDIFPEYMQKFLAEYKKNPEKSFSENHLRLTALMYDELKDIDNDFIKEYYDFERTLRNTLSALMGRATQKSFDHELIGNEEWIENLKKSHAVDFGLAKTNELIDKIIKIWHTEDLYKREKDLDHFRWSWIEQRNFFHYFDIDVILAYICRLKLAYRWQLLDKEKGKEIFRSTIRKMESSFQFNDINTL